MSSSNAPLDFITLIQSAYNLLTTPNNNLTTPNNNGTAMQAIINLSPISPLLQPPIPTTFPNKVATIIDHTLLSPTMTTKDCDKLCQEAINYNFASVCIPPSFVKRAKAALTGSQSKVCTVVGFPNGYASSAVKGYEAKVAQQEGADEVDMVCNIGLVKEITEKAEKGEWEIAARAAEDYISDILTVCTSVGPSVTVKCIIESGALTDTEIAISSLLFSESRRRNGGTSPTFIKTSTGFNGNGGATPRSVEIMSRIVRPGGGKVKASGGVGSMDNARVIVGKGAERIGASKGVKIVEGEEGGEGY